VLSNAAHLNASHIKEFDKFKSQEAEYEEKVTMYLQFVSYGMTRNGRPVKNKEMYEKCGISRTAAHT